MIESKPEISFSIGARHNVPSLIGDRPVVILLHSNANRLLIDEIRVMFGSRLKEILQCPDGLMTVDTADQIREQFFIHFPLWL